MFGQLKWFFENKAEIAIGLGLLYAFVSFVAKKTPTKKDDEKLAAARAILERLGLMEPESEKK